MNLDPDSIQVLRYASGMSTARNSICKINETTTRTTQIATGRKMNQSKIPMAHGALTRLRCQIWRLCNAR